jgi:hypothetical protein
MKKIIKTSITGLFIALFTLTSCSDEDPIGSSVTVYPIIDVQGDNILFAPQGETFADPGAVATVDDAEIPVTVRYTGMYQGQTYTETLETAVPDIYTASYTATNADGFPRSATRQVFVGRTGDLVNSIEGLYTSTVFRNGAQGAPASAYTDIKYIIIWKNADGSYQISDAFGGWYLFARAIAGSETPGGIIVAEDIATNSFTFPGTQTNSYFGGSSEITGLTVNAADKSLNLTTVWQADPATKYTFEVRLKQVQF